MKLVESLPSPNVNKGKNKARSSTFDYDFINSVQGLIYAMIGKKIMQLNKWMKIEVSAA